VEEALANLREATELFLGEYPPSRLAERQQGAGARTRAVGMGRSLTRREARPRDAVGVRRTGDDSLPLPARLLAGLAQKRLGFEEVRQKGSHLVLRRTTTKADGRAAVVICVVPLHRRDLAVGTCASVQRQAGLDGDTFIQAL
jgi:predicted RNA binding protein YcfA (HicA-like mRNA interferase family)